MVIYLIGIGIGLFLLAAGLFNWDAWFVDYESQVVQLLGGETMVRWCWGLCGLVVIGLSLFYWFKP